MGTRLISSYRDSHRNQLDASFFVVLTSFVFTCWKIYLKTNDELIKAIFIQSCFASTWTIGDILRIYSLSLPVPRLFTCLFRCTVTFLNCSAILMMFFYEDFALCLLLLLSLVLNKSLFFTGPILSPGTCSLIEWLILSVGCSILFLILNIHWWSLFGNIIYRPIPIFDYAVVCESLLLFGLLVTLLQIVPWSRTINSSSQFYLSVFIIFTGVFLPQAFCFVDENPFVWLFNYIIKKTHRIYLLMFWLVISVTSVFVIYFHLQLINQNEANLQKTSIRKYFHFLAVIVYTSGIFIDKQLLTMCSVAFIVLLMLLECMKIKNVYPLGNFIKDAWQIYANDKDVGTMMMSHMFLIIGLSYPVWLADDSQRLAQLSGVISVGIGDSAASIIGSKIGKHRWPGRKRTIEGSTAGFLAQFAFISSLWYLGLIPSIGLNIMIIMLGLILTSLVEAFSEDIDNLILPITLFPFLYFW